MQPVTDISMPPDQALGLSVIIPACNEPDLAHTLQSLANCERPEIPTEVIVVINHSENASLSTIVADETCLKQVSQYARDINGPRFKLHPLYFPDLPDKYAGVGLARKLGLDLALKRQKAADVSNGVLLNLDADCLVEPNYLQAVWQAFNTNPRLCAASIHFGHRLDELKNDSQRTAAVLYELHLRLYVSGLRQAAYPYAFHTIGSCMAVRARDYRKLGGMNRRQAGEDFYFLEKFILHGEYGNITETCVYPSARASNRAPYGTGVKISEWSMQPEMAVTYPISFYRDIELLMQCLENFHRLSTRETIHALESLPDSLATFLMGQRFPEAVEEINMNTASAASFRQRILRWLKPFRIMKYANFSRENYGGAPVNEVARKLATDIGCGGEINPDLYALLDWYRELDRQRG